MLPLRLVLIVADAMKLCSLAEENSLTEEVAGPLVVLPEIESRYSGVPRVRRHCVRTRSSVEMCARACIHTCVCTHECTLFLFDSHARAGVQMRVRVSVCHDVCVCICSCAEGIQQKKRKFSPPMVLPEQS